MIKNVIQPITEGEFVDLEGERFYAIRNVDKIAPFFISVTSNSDHWLFVSSAGGLTAGRVSPDTALFPYVTVDKIHESELHTGSKTIVQLLKQNRLVNWEPYNREHNQTFEITRNLYKNLLGNKLCFEEINHDLKLCYRVTWSTSDQYGFVRSSKISNLSDDPVELNVLDGLQNILPAGTPQFTQTNSSNLVDAYKWSELDKDSGLALFTLFSAITDRAEPCESLRANTVFCLGLENHQTLLSSSKLEQFKRGYPVQTEMQNRGVRGAYFVTCAIKLKAKQNKQWQMIANVEQSQAQAVSLTRQLAQPEALATKIMQSIENGNDELAKIMASADGFQLTAEENVSVHHYANVLFNVLRGGIFDDQYNICTIDFCRNLARFNLPVYNKHQQWLETLSGKIQFAQLLKAIQSRDDSSLERLCYEYLPIAFGRRHGDPSRPWNHFAIELVDENDDRLLSYQGNWRDIFQNWEALCFSYPEFTENVIAKFVNASTVDGYNPYRVTKEGFDWEVEDPSDPWSYIGYWGDHQIIYLQKLLELSVQFHPARLQQLLDQEIFSYANVPYRIKSFDELVKDAKNTVIYDQVLADKIALRVEKIGADGKLILDAEGNVYQVSLFEKLLVPLLSKLSNFVVDGGIWLNTQRPEWNDANNALVGQGISTVTLYYLRRYLVFIQQLIKNSGTSFSLSIEVIEWLEKTDAALAELIPLLGKGKLTEQQRFNGLKKLGEAACDYRQRLYEQGTFSGKKTVDRGLINQLVEHSLQAVDHTISVNQRTDGLYHAYNLLSIDDAQLSINYLYPMLEGQVAVLSSGALSASQSISLINRLFESDIYRDDQKSFMLYPDRKLPSFLEKNQVSRDKVERIPLLVSMLTNHDQRLILADENQAYRFNPELTNSKMLAAQLEPLKQQYGSEVDVAKESLLELYEEVFNHQAFTGRSGGMFGFEGLGCIYWHMVSKLLLAVKESFFAAIDNDAKLSERNQLAELYYKVRQGIGFNKTPEEYGAFPTDPYSHTPKHAGARQPGMTGQVKEELLARFGELGIRVKAGQVHWQPHLLRSCEFIDQADEFCYLSVSGSWNTLDIPAQSIAFTWCQVPIVYTLDDKQPATIIINWNNGRTEKFNDFILSEQISNELFERSGKIASIHLRFDNSQLFQT
jgi:hypothetical protein